MKLVMYQFGERDYRLGAVTNEERVVDLNYAYETHLTRKGVQRAKELAQALVPPDSVEFLSGGGRSWEAARAALDEVQDFSLEDLSSSGKRLIFQRSEVKLGAPVQNPMRIVCLSHNYHDFIRETGLPIPPEPRIFAKYKNALCGPDDPIIYPRMTQCLGYEAELAFVIGKKGRNVPVEKAFDYVAGYMIFNDVSASDLTALDKQVVRGKTFDNFAPCGPYLVSRDEIPDPGNLDVKLWVNGRLLQDSNTRELIYDVPTLVSFLSRIFTLQPGDIVATGTPGGLAKDRKPPTYMQVGDICTIEITGLGRLSNKIVAEEDISF
ncbi:Fumarylacetoacetate (FAA) hydrolase family protein [Neomoorella glycerini]|uniref:Fumarylacetoacetate (FAA) hydrolase family protein n=1 Tax=Neomoorella glycerini TaxID=55779 RepID=A0A6I5ZVE2_9FIRM|nr:fumarylacetoacetate hydrolase family protein [Moorella glycerini]QGP94023.1 Fumarylacetoacetate (FAA) hydrolase family protein [Moorella glycerini]